jgi:cobalt-zinc-cadmium efflux system outer membrane protein
MRSNVPTLRVASGAALVGLAVTLTPALAAEPSAPPRLTLAAALSAALARDAVLTTSRAATLAARARSTARTPLPAPELRAQLWAMPLTRLAPDHQSMVMLGVGQRFPAPGARTAAEQEAEAEVRISAAAEAARALDVVLEVRAAYAAYRRAEADAALHQEHHRLASHIAELVRAHYEVEESTQSDLLRARLELTRIDRELVRVEEERRAAAARLASLMDWPEGAALPPPSQDEDALAAPTDEETEARRPELAAALGGVERSSAALAGAERRATWPSLMVSVDYMLMPHDERPHRYGAMLAVELPWLSGRARAEASARAAELAAEQRALEAARRGVRREVEEARARFEGARASLELLEERLLPEVERSFVAAEAAFLAGRRDALTLFEAARTLLGTRLDRVRAVEALAVRHAELERAAGLGLEASAERGAGR